MTSFLARNKHLDKVQSQEFDLVVIGGGITGAGVARDAAMQGYSVCLVEQNDFAEGTSSRSSKLAHGGLRYLESLEFSLVSEALHERQNLLRMAPHMVQPMPFLMPIYKGDRVSYFKMSMGMLLYDILSAMEAPFFHKSLSSRKIKEDYPTLKDEDLKGGFLYPDAIMDDDRLVLETLRSAVDYGAVVLSYAQALDYKTKDNGVELTCHDRIGAKNFLVKAKHAVGCVGPWTDLFGEIVDSSWKKKTRPSKGVHITLPKDRLNLKTSVVMAADNQNRILFCIPRHDFDIIGTTDTDFVEDPSLVRTEKEDVDYILNVLNEYFPDVNLSEKDILFSYAGVRPLMDDGSESESKVSRKHWLKTYKEHKVTFISGGKYTTYLSMAEDTMKEAAKFLPFKEKRQNTRISFFEQNTLESIESAKEKIKDYKLSWSEREQNFFVERHGLRALFYLEECPYGEVAQVEAFIAIHHYFCGSLKDFYFRRSPYLLMGVDEVKRSLKDVEEVFKNDLAWSDRKLEEERDDLFESIAFESAWRVDSIPTKV